MQIRDDYFERRGGRFRGVLAHLSLALTAIVAMAIGAVVVLALQQTDIGARLLGSGETPVPAPVEGIERDFVACAGPVRVTCVVDGDTFWLDGTKIRIADINTPEIGQPQCAAEAKLGRQATQRLAQLLSAGPFILKRVDRDEDQYGRKLRLVWRDGQSIGATLVGEGLAHEWRGQRNSWC